MPPRIVRMKSRKNLHLEVEKENDDMDTHDRYCEQCLISTRAAFICAFKAETGVRAGHEL